MIRAGVFDSVCLKLQLDSEGRRALKDIYMQIYINEAWTSETEVLLRAESLYLLKYPKPVSKRKGRRKSAK
jgi:hypothetical protein